MSDSGSDVKVERSPEEVEATVSKLRAEAQKIRAEARRESWEGDRARHLAEKARIDAESHVLAEQISKVSDWHRRVYRFEDSVSAGSVRRCIDHLEEWHRLDPDCPVEVIFLSPGGSVIHGMALFDELCKLSRRGGGTHHVTIGAQGYAASMAGILLQAGDTRWIGRRSYLMIHEISAGASGKIGEIEDSFKFYERICEQVTDIFVDRADGKVTKEYFQSEWKRKDWWLMSEEALEHGFVDEIR